jgi:menaquinone-dependent protoporphyrinogen oxidase
MKVLVAVASKQGATKEIAECIGEVLRSSGLETVVQPVEAATGLDRYDAVVLGSAVRIGHWIEPARRFVRDYADELAGRPVWLFSSGPVGDPPKPDAEPLDIAELMPALHPRNHRVFAGKLDKRGLGLAERAITGAMKAPEGDFRPWAEIEAWAAAIAQELSEVSVPAI